MAKTRSKYVCNNCGRQSASYMGRCPNCGQFNTMEEVVEERASTKASKQNRQPVGTVRASPQRLTEISMEMEERYFVPIEEFNRVLGGGIVPGSIVLIGGDPGIGKCVTGDTRVLNPLTGEYLPITEWESKKAPVLAVDTQSMCLDPANVTHFHKQGERPIVEVTTRLGRTLRCTANHPLLTEVGWKPVEALQVGDRIASPRALPYFGEEELPEEQLKLIAYILSDGSATTQINITSMLSEVEEDVYAIGKAFGMRVRKYDKKNTVAKHYRFVKLKQNMSEIRQPIAEAIHQAKEDADISWTEWCRQADANLGMMHHWKAGKTVPDLDTLQRLADAIDILVEDLHPDLCDQSMMVSPMARYLEDLGLRYTNASNKFIPDIIFRLSKAQISLFLKILFSCDGSVYADANNHVSVSYSTISKRLAEDIQHLLLRFGFTAKLRTKTQQVNDEDYVAYELQILGRSETKYFLSQIGIYGREDAKEKIDAMDLPNLPSTHMDTIPTGQIFWQHIYDVCGTNFAEISRTLGFRFRNRRHERPLTRYTVQRIADVYPHPYFQSLADGDVYWDEIVSITPAGTAEVYDISVPEYENFVANDLIIHNSTILLQLSAILAKDIGKVLYVSGEESAKQIKMRADRLSLSADDLFLLTETNLSNIFEQVNQVDPTILVIDSIQTVYTDQLDSAPGLVSQVRECASRLQALAKSSGICVFLVGHVTKEGNIAGPRVLEHLVDTVLYLEGDPFQAFRLLRSVKNRFGATSEVGVFEMQGAGMVEVTNPSEAFLAERVINASGSAIAVTMEGTRPLLVEIQALTSPTSFGNPRRTPNGVDFNRLLLISAVMGKRVGLRLHEQDIFINVIGGLKVTEPASDLAMAMAIASSYYDRSIPADMAIMGEVGLSGEIRAVSQLSMRLNEASKIGFKRIIVPRMRRKVPDIPDGIQIIPVRNVVEALDAILPEK